MILEKNGRKHSVISCSVCCLNYSTFRELTIFSIGRLHSPNFPISRAGNGSGGGECFKNKEYKQIKTLRRLTLKKLRNCSWKW